jgi:hypothetical protein
MPTLHIDDAIEHLVGYLRDEITNPPPRLPVISDSRYGCDLWLPIVVANFWRSRGHPTFTADPRQPQGAAYYHPFYDAAWELCRIGVLRPGRNASMGDIGAQSWFQGDGFSLTEFGRGWVQTPSIRRAIRVGAAQDDISSMSGYVSGMQNSAISLRRDNRMPPSIHSAA